MDTDRSHVTSHQLGHNVHRRLLHDQIVRMKSGDGKKEARIMVLGSAGVGKSALIVRCVTRRFIHDYDPLLESLQNYTTEIDGKTVTLQLLDTAGFQEFPTAEWDAEIHWADGFLLAFSVTDKESFGQIAKIRDYIAVARDDDNPPIVLVANKVDLVHMRVVSPQDVASLALRMRCLCREVAASEDIDRVRDVFADLFRAVRLKHKQGRRKGSDGLLMHKERSRLRMAFNLFVKDKNTGDGGDSRRGEEDFGHLLARDRTYTM